MELCRLYKEYHQVQGFIVGPTPILSLIISKLSWAICCRRRSKATRMVPGSVLFYWYKREARAMLGGMLRSNTPTWHASDTYSSPHKQTRAVVLLYTSKYFEVWRRQAWDYKHPTLTYKLKLNSVLWCYFWLLVSRHENYKKHHTPAPSRVVSATRI